MNGEVQLSTKLQGTQKFYKFLLGQIDTGRLTIAEAVDMVSDIDPETHLGRALNELLIKVSNYNLLDFYLGYDREPRVIKAYFSQNVRIDKLMALAEQMTEQGEASAEVPYAVQADVYKKPDEKDTDKYLYVVKLVLSGDSESDVVTPEEANVAGEIVPGEQPGKGKTSEEVFS